MHNTVYPVHFQFSQNSILPHTIGWWSDWSGSTGPPFQSFFFYMHWRTMALKFPLHFSVCRLSGECAVAGRLPSWVVRQWQVVLLRAPEQALARLQDLLLWEPPRCVPSRQQSRFPHQTIGGWWSRGGTGAIAPYPHGRSGPHPSPSLLLLSLSRNSCPQSQHHTELRAPRPQPLAAGQGQEKRGRGD